MDTTNLAKGLYEVLRMNTDKLNWNQEKRWFKMHSLKLRNLLKPGISSNLMGLAGTPSSP